MRKCLAGVSERPSKAINVHGLKILKTSNFVDEHFEPVFPLQLHLCLYGYPQFSRMNLACVASVSVGFGSKERERGFRYFACAENGTRAKKRTVGVGEGKEGTACGQTPGF